MAVSLSFSDTGDGTGGTATVAGGNASDINTLFYNTWTGLTGAMTFTSAGSRTGNGTIAASVSVGLYIWLLENVTTGGTKTNCFYYQPTTTTASSGNAVHYRVMLQVQTQIRALSLTGISSSDVVVKWLYREFDGTTDPRPQIVISPGLSPEPMPIDLFNTDKVHYPVLVTMCSAQNQDYTANLNRNLLWREKINREFRYRNLIGIPEIIHCLPSPREIISPQWFGKNFAVSQFLLYFVSRETRGN